MNNGSITSNVGNVGNPHNMNNTDTFVRSEVFTVPKINIADLWGMTTCSLTAGLERHAASTSDTDSDSIFEHNLQLLVYRKKTHSLLTKHYDMHKYIFYALFLYMLLALCY
jgi:hypothetical protein